MIQQATATIHVRNEIWTTVTGLSKYHSDFLWELFGPYVEGYRHMLNFKLGRWDGKIRFFEKTGKTYTKLILRIIPYLETWGYEIDLKDDRNYFDAPPKIALNPFPNENVALRPYQQQSINLGIESGCGFIIAGTGAGKTLITAGISHAYSDAGYDTITIVPSADLVTQTVEFYNYAGLDTGVYSGDDKDIHHKNVVATWQALQYNMRVLEGFQCLIWDECFAGHEKVLTPFGLISIQNLKKGDIIYSMSDDGSFIEDIIVKIHKNLKKSETVKMLRLEFDNGNSFEVTENHEFFTKCHGRVAAKDLQDFHELIEFDINKLLTS